MVVHQLIPSFAPGDAMAQAALHFQVLLRRLGHWGEVFASEVSPQLTALAQPAEKLWESRYDWVLYHHGIASPLSGMLLHLPRQRGIIYHNVSPAHFYRQTSLEEALVAGRAQLAAMSPYVDLAIGVSKFNRAELKEVGYQNIHQVPLFIEPERFSPSFADPTHWKKMKALGPYLLFVGRLVAHKRAEDVVALLRELRRANSRMNAVFVGSFDAGSRYFRGLRKEANRVGNCHFLGKVSHAELVATYRAASAFVTMSEHEGFGLPLLEAMASDVPVLAFCAGAVPEVLGRAGIQFSSKQFLPWAEQTTKVIRDEGFREKILALQRRQLRRFSPEAAQLKLSEAFGRRTGRARARKASRQLRIGVLVQRFGEVSGGAERHAHLIAEQLAKEFQVTVLTSCARDHLTWANEFPPGLSVEGGIAVHRFPSVAKRNIREFNALSKGIFHQGNDRLSEELWVGEQGPRCPTLLEHLSKESDTYDAFIAFTYLYSPVVFGLPIIGHKALLVPTAHDEPPLRLYVYRDVFEAPRVLLCNTPEEAELIRRQFPRHARIRIAGVGIETQAARVDQFRARFKIQPEGYLLYVGRIEPGKGINDLLTHYASARRHLDRTPELLLAGSLHMKISQAGVRYIGRISDQEKVDGITGATAVVVPSTLESLSLLALEAFAQGTPVIANASSPVLSGQVKRSGGGITFRDRASFAAAIQRARQERAAFADHGRKFAQLHSWSRVLEIYRDELNRIAERK